MLRTCLCIVLLAVAVSALKSCPVINAQIEGSSVSASWTGLDRKEVLTVEWAVAQGNFDDSSNFFQIIEFCNKKTKY